MGWVVLCYAMCAVMCCDVLCNNTTAIATTAICRELAGLLAVAKAEHMYTHGDTHQQQQQQQHKQQQQQQQQQQHQQQQQQQHEARVCALRVCSERLLCVLDDVCAETDEAHRGLLLFLQVRFRE
jgi:flagellar biosynthesis component FlhA